MGKVNKINLVYTVTSAGKFDFQIDIIICLVERRIFPVSTLFVNETHSTKIPKVHKISVDFNRQMF